MKPLPLFLLALFSAMTLSAKTDSLVLGGGCFWCTEAAYELLPGVKDVVSGYAGGKEPNPTYEQVCAHRTGHAEVIRIEPPGGEPIRQLLLLAHIFHPRQLISCRSRNHSGSYLISNRLRQRK